MARIQVKQTQVPVGDLPSSVVNGSPTGGAEPWKAKTKYAVNLLRSSAEVNYLCLEAHESGETFPGAGSKWAPIAGFAVEVSAPAPTGVAATDTANLQAALNAAAGGLCRITKPGVYAINATLKRPYNTSIYGPWNVTLRAEAVIAGPVVSDSNTERSIRQGIYGGFTIDSNNKAQHALWCRYFQRGMVLGVRCMNSTQSDVILGDLAATAISDEAAITPEFMCDRNMASVPVGCYGVWAQRCSDSRLYGSVLTGQETGLRIDNGGWRTFGAHPDGAAYPMQVGIEDNAASEHVTPNLDTPTPGVHTEATGEEVSTVITDAEILSQHKGRPVVGVNIPAESFVGTVTASTSFILVNAKGEAVKPTGAVSGITLEGVGYLPRENGFQLIGGQVFVSATYGVDKGCVGIAVSSNITNGIVLGFRSNGGDAEHRVTQAIVGKTSAVTWIGLAQSNTVNASAELHLPAGSIISEALATGSVTAAKLGSESVETAKIKAAAVTGAKVASGTVESGNVKPASVPAAGAEGTTTLGTPGVLRKIVAVFVGDGATTAVKIKHELGTNVVRAVALKGGGREQPTTALGKWASNGSPTTAEGTYTFTAAPAKGEEMFITVEG